MADRLFVYGSLRRDVRNSVFHLIGDEATFVGLGRVCGRLYDLGEYPGLVPSSDRESWVHGELYEVDHPSNTLARLDDYEGCGPRSPRPHAFERVTLEVVQESGALEKAWVYVYRGATLGRRRIVSGDYSDDAG